MQGLITVVTRVYIALESLRVSLFAMVSTSLLLLAFVAPDGSPRLTTFSLLVCKVPVISEFHKIIKQFKRYAESSLPDGRCGPVSPSSLLGPCAPVSLLSCL